MDVAAGTFVIVIGLAGIAVFAYNVFTSARREFRARRNLKRMERTRWGL